MTARRPWTLTGGALLVGAALLAAGCPNPNTKPPDSQQPGNGNGQNPSYQPRDYFYPASATQKNVMLMTTHYDFPLDMPDEVSTASMTMEVTAYAANSAEVKTTTRFDIPEQDTTVASSSVSTASYTVESDGTVVVHMADATERYGQGVFTSSGATVSSQVRMALAAGPESVQVPAGTFNALRFNVTNDEGTNPTWYAKGVGAVKSRMISTFSVEVGTAPATASGTATASTQLELLSTAP